MNYAAITKQDMLNGDGIRVTLWVQGCNRYCKGCHNPETWDRCLGQPWTEESEQELFEALDKDYISGITYSGGHPLEKYNIETVTDISKKIKEKFPNKTQWLYTGFVWEDIKDLEIMKYIDVLVDGPYIEEQRDISLKWRGSSNQRCIDVQKSLELNQIVLYCD